MDAMDFMERQREGKRAAQDTAGIGRRSYLKQMLFPISVALTEGADDLVEDLGRDSWWPTQLWILR